MTHDGIIIGAGHNGLVLQAYLCRAGLDVISIDRREVSGGGLDAIVRVRFADGAEKRIMLRYAKLEIVPD